jgi:uncharacterized protein
MKKTKRVGSALFLLIAVAVIVSCQKNNSLPGSIPERAMMESLVRRFLYYPEKIPVGEPLPHYIHGAAEVFFDTADGNRINALHWPAPPGRPTILFFHGNAQTVFEWAMIREELEPLECGLFLVDYPGYGKSSGEPSEQANYAAGHAAFEHLVKTAIVEPGQIIIFGKSLGGGISTEIAKGAKVRGVILESTFTSIPAIARRLLPMIPADAIFKSECYESASKIASIESPILVIYGERDDLIPVSEGKRLFELAREPKMLYLVPRAGHNDVAVSAGADYGRTLRAWIDGLK